MRPNIGASHAHDNTNFGAQSGRKMVAPGHSIVRTVMQRSRSIFQVAKDANVLKLNELIAEAFRIKPACFGGVNGTGSRRFRELPFNPCTRSWTVLPRDSCMSSTVQKLAR